MRAGKKISFFFYNQRKTVGSLFLFFKGAVKSCRRTIQFDVFSFLLSENVSVFLTFAKKARNRLKTNPPREYREIIFLVQKPRNWKPVKINQTEQKGKNSIKTNDDLRNVRSSGNIGKGFFPHRMSNWRHRSIKPRPWKNKTRWNLCRIRRTLRATHLWLGGIVIKTKRIQSIRKQKNWEKKRRTISLSSGNSSRHFEPRLYRLHHHYIAWIITRTINPQINSKKKKINK